MNMGLDGLQKKKKKKKAPATSTFKGVSSAYSGWGGAGVGTGIPGLSQPEPRVIVLKISLLIILSPLRRKEGIELWR